MTAMNENIELMMPIKAAPYDHQKKAFAFGSYGWGDGAWMRDWEDRVRNDGAKLFADGLTIENTPDDDGVAACQKLGKEFADSL